jgi:hypothetical protein
MASIYMDGCISDHAFAGAPANGTSLATLRFHRKDDPWYRSDDLKIWIGPDEFPEAIASISALLREMTDHHILAEAEKAAAAAKAAEEIPTVTYDGPA